MATVTKESDLQLWQRLCQNYSNEGRPAYVMAGSVQYQVIQSADDGDLEFISVTAEDLHNSTSGFPGRPS